MRSTTHFAALMLATTITCQALAAEAARPKSRVAWDDDREAGTLTVSIDGREAFVYQYGDDVDIAHYYPVNSPAGHPMTVQKTDPYPHHRSFWFGDKVRLDGGRPVSTYGALYSESKEKNAPRRFKDGVRHVRTTVDDVAENQATFTKKLLWYMDFDRPVLDETRNLRVVALGDGEYFLDVTFTVTAAYGEVAFVSDAVHYAWPYLRMNRQFSVQGGGRIINSQGGVDQKGTNGKVACWVDYSNTSGDNDAGLAVFSHPSNPQPHAWLTRDYGTFGPRRIDARSGKPFTLKRGESQARRVGVLVHCGDVKAGRVAERYEQYAQGAL